MKVGFLAIDKQPVDVREAKIALFDNGHTLDVIMTVGASDIDFALNQLRSVCDAIVISGNINAFYDTYKDTLSSRPENFDLDGKIHSVSREITPEFLTEKFIPLLNKKSKKKFGVIVFKTYGKSEAELRTLLKDYMGKKSKVQLGFFPDFLECEVHARCAATMAKEEMNGISLKLNELLYGCTYSYDRISITERVAQMLAEEGLKIKIAESFTGGALGSAFTMLPGASEYLVEDLVTYSITSKNKRLGVPLEVIAEHGAVSGDTAYNMALGLMSSGDCDIAIATTGNAGPTVQNGNAGLCFVALGIASEKSIAVVKYTFGSDRETNIKSGVKNAMFLLYESLVSYKQKLKRRRAQAAQQQQYAAAQQQQYGAQQYAPQQQPVSQQYATAAQPQQQPTQQQQQTQFIAPSLMPDIVTSDDDNQ
ncbi:MAG: CinA family protein [Clostridiales bacterium]|nr:CinA family protein [Clostridiales bacterium]